MLSMLAVFAFSAVASATASAACAGPPECIWEVKETEAGAFRKLEAEEEWNIGANETTTFKLVQGTHEVKCTAISSLATLIGGQPGKDNTYRIKFTGCTTNSTTSTCKVKSKGNAPSGEILVTNIKTELVEDPAGTLADRFTQKLRNGEKEFVTLEIGTTQTTNNAGTPFENKTLTGACTGFPGSTKVKGHVDATVGTEELKFPAVVPAGSALEASGLAATLSGSVKLPSEEPGEYRGK